MCSLMLCSALSSMQLLFRLQGEGLSAESRGRRGTSCPQQWNISSVLRPLLTEWARRHTESEHLLHSNALLPRSQNIRVGGKAILFGFFGFFLVCF